MPLAKFSCPKCRAVLRPARPVAEGKTVKCPKCEETFKVGEDPAEAKTAVKSAGKKPAAAAEPAEDEEAGTYAVVRDEEEERKKAEKEERERRRKLKRKRLRQGIKDEDDDGEEDEEEDNGEYDLAKELLRNLKARDPRGAAQEVMVTPANLLLVVALIGFFGWVGYFIAFMLPIAFPVKQEDAGGPAPPGAVGEVTPQMLARIQEKSGLGAQNTERLRPLMGKKFPTQDAFLKEVRKTFPDREDLNAIAKATATDWPKVNDLHWWSAETILDEDNTPWSVLLFLFVLLLGVVQVAIIAIAAMKMQHLESYKWSMWGVILAMIPLTSAPLWILLTSSLELLDSGIDLFGQDEKWMNWAVALVAFLIGPAIGAFGLRRLLLPQTRPGFDYKPD
jgi:hypothetical protein